jgi:hypothetical protein
LIATISWVAAAAHRTPAEDGKTSERDVDRRSWLFLTALTSFAFAAALAMVTTAYYDARYLLPTILCSLMAVAAWSLGPIRNAAEAPRAGPAAERSGRWHRSFQAAAAGMVVVAMLVGPSAAAADSWLPSPRAYTPVGVDPSSGVPPGLDRCTSSFDRILVFDDDLAFRLSQYTPAIILVRPSNWPSLTMADRRAFLNEYRATAVVVDGRLDPRARAAVLDGMPTRDTGPVPVADPCAIGLYRLEMLAS